MAGRGYKRSNQNRTVFDQSFEARVLSRRRIQFQEQWDEIKGREPDDDDGDEKEEE